MSTNRVVEAIRVVVMKNRHAVKPDTIFDIEGNITEVHKPYAQKIEHRARLEFGLNFLVDEDVTHHNMDVPKHIVEIFIHEFYGDIKRDAMDAMREVYKMSNSPSDNIDLINTLSRIIDKCSV
jgi:hypothetical protein